MNIASICAIAIVTAILSLMIKQKNAEIALMLSICCSVMILSAIFSYANSIVQTVNSIVASSNINIEYIKIMLKAIGICIATEFTVSICKEAGQQGIATNVLLAGKILVIVVSLPLYSDILNTIKNLISGNL